MNDNQDKKNGEYVFWTTPSCIGMSGNGAQPGWYSAPVNFGWYITNKTIMKYLNGCSFLEIWWAWGGSGSFISGFVSVSMEWLEFWTTYAQVGTIQKTGTIIGNSGFIVIENIPAIDWEWRRLTVAASDLIRETIGDQPFASISKSAIKITTTPNVPYNAYGITMTGISVLEWYLLQMPNSFTGGFLSTFWSGISDLRIVMNSGVSLSSPVTIMSKMNIPGGSTWKFWIKPKFTLEIPWGTAVGDYEWIITFTLYEWWIN
jgi:hypothetical protein